jgi:hypothetical protein
MSGENGTVIIIAPQKYYYISIITRILPDFLKNLSWEILLEKRGCPILHTSDRAQRTRSLKKPKHPALKHIHFEAFECPPIWFSAITPNFVLLTCWMSFVNKFDRLSPLSGTFMAALKK